MSDTDERRETLLVKLEQDYSSLDSTLVRAIAVDLDPLTQIVQLREILATLSLETQNDDYDGSFDPSGMGGDSANTASQETSESSNVQSKSTSKNSNQITTKTSSGGSSETEDSEQYKSIMTAMMHLDDEEKVQNLRAFFPDEPLARIEFLLKKSHGDFTIVLDTLLNNTFMASDTPTKSVDGFIEERVFSSRKKTKRNRAMKNPGGEQHLLIGASAFKKTDAEIDPSPPSKIPTHRPTKSMNYSPPSSPRFASSSDASMAWTEANRKAAATYRSPALGRYAGAAASVYHSTAASIRTDYDHLSKADADRLVSATATRTEIDLHGVSVAHAIRIALARTKKWWDELDDEHKHRAHLRNLNEFRIITGIGNHSVGGVGKLGPAVFRSLVANGWKASSSRGIVYVTGHQK